MLAPAATEPSTFSHWVETVKNICEIMAILVGGAWTYLNYFRGRTYKPRLECSVEAAIERHGGHAFLRTSIRLRNIGLSSVQIEPKGTALLIYAVTTHDPPPPLPTEVRWSDPVAAFDLFDGETWVEPTEPIAESMLLALPDVSAQTYKAVLNVASRGIWWTAETIVSDNKKS